MKYSFLRTTPERSRRIVLQEGKLFRKLFEEIREKIILPFFIFPDYFSENFEWGFKTAGLFLHLPVHVPMGNS